MLKKISSKLKKISFLHKNHKKTHKKNLKKNSKEFPKKFRKKLQNPYKPPKASKFLNFSQNLKNLS